jgi:methionyl-tRNA formyltransferase
MKVFFTGGSDISLPSLETLASRGWVAAVMTHPDTYAGRGKKRKVNPVKAAALDLGIPVVEAAGFDAELETEIRKYESDLLVVVSYGKILPESFLRLFPEGGINLHPSLLPKYRGPSPITAVILAGERETGVTVQRLSKRMDSGDILAQLRVELRGAETGESLAKRLGEIGAGLLAEVVAGFERGDVEGVPQREAEATYCPLLKKEDGLIEWEKDAESIERMTRALLPWPRAYTIWNGQVLYILEASVYPNISPPRGEPGKVLGVDKEEGILIQTGNGVLAVKKLQKQAKKAMDWKSFINGTHNFTGTVLGT